ncbi:glycoprotein 3-alpha-L-fucosyltransferase A [Parasteatoda tepidariorum]|uniref:glycoprotein 3-alpha-L-fucosyltransferase A n=1 Tax=Parasteatoda tepidariorum TaxID=114398 RepID=UPI001C7293BA|nr:glycoprotein 3-alpha-L-fucosyltransferase A [Parasteatoda tepidariorum]XP_042900212.1 glycoprotein 3-alpha-L-fucosyltransferase A [Parasteatoda tepidariorum]XP_042900213.1 glycoprotein 3-alpha-L-fucosyltransferase A [Parasteatoda tepidariorum]
MYHEIRTHFSRIPLRILYKNLCIFILSLPIVTLIFVLLYSPQESFRSYVYSIGSSENLRNSLRTIHALENPIESAKKEQSNNFTIHVWRHGERMKRRFLRSYGKVSKDPFEFCSVSNCVLSTNDSIVNNSDAVLFHLHQTKGPHTLPSEHPDHQIWIFFTDESPLHTFYASRKYSMKDYNGLFNWSMTYRSDSDIPVPYGRTVPLSDTEKEQFKPKNHAAVKSRGIAILGSNCGGQNHRWDYVHELQNYISVDIYGGCGTHKCPGHFMKDCPIISDYKFYLAFENSNCREYITEKLWWNAYHKEAVPVVMGAPKEDYLKLCPPKSFIHTDDFKSPADLAKYLEFLMEDDEAYNSYFEWQQEFKVVNEHGYFGSPSLHLCRICEALNYKRSNLPKIYDNLDSFWNPKTDCFKASWKPAN